MSTTLTGTKKGNNVFGDVNFNNDTLFVSSSGNVGVGVNNPSALIHASGSADVLKIEGLQEQAAEKLQHVH